MKINKRVTLTFAEADVKGIICEYLLSQGYTVNIEDIVLDIGTRYEGYGPMEHLVPCFKECRVEIKED